MAIKTNKAIKLSQKHLLGIQDLSINDVNLILDEASTFIGLNKSKHKKLNTLNGKTQINLFFEPSTRTQSSFELAGKRLGADVMSMNITNSAISFSFYFTIITSIACLTNSSLFSHSPPMSCISNFTFHTLT